jgi:transcriptional regulator with XRE-family HTH domain
VVKAKSDIEVDIAIHMIDRLLVQKNMHRKDLAEKVGVTKAAVSQWLNGKYRIPEKYMIAIARALGVDSRMIFPDRTVLSKLSGEEASKT